MNWRQILGDVLLFTGRNLWIQLDGCSAQYKCGNDRINVNKSRRDSASNAPNLMPLHFYLRRVLQQILNHTKVNTREELLQRICNDN